MQFIDSFHTTVYNIFNIYSKGAADMSNELLKKVSEGVIADQLLILRGDRVQAKMAELCGMSLRHYCDLEHRRCSVLLPTMVNLYTAGVDLNKWAEETWKRYEKAKEKEES